LFDIANNIINFGTEFKFIQFINMLITFAILALSAFLFIQGRIRTDVVAVCALLALMLLKIITPEQGLSGFSNSVVIMMVGLFIVGGAIFQTGLAKMIGNSIIKLAGTSETKLLILTILVTAIIGAFVSNTGTVALMLPIIVSMAMGANMSSKRLLMPLAFASSMGGMLTLIGTPPNLIINDKLIEAGYEGLSFFSFLPVGLVSLTVGLIVLVPLSKFFLSDKESSSKNNGKKGRTLQELAAKYQLSKNIYQIKITANSLVLDKELKDLSIPQKYGISILELHRKVSSNLFQKTIQETAGPNTILLENDVIYVMGDFENIDNFTKDTNTLLEEANSGNLSFREVGIAEVVLMPDSKLANIAVKDSGFREKYNLSILSVHRKNKSQMNHIQDVKLHGGDSILIQGSWDDIARLTEEHSESDWVVIGQPLAEASKITRTEKAPVAAGIMVLMVLCMVFNLVPGVVAVLSAAILMVLTGCLRNMEDAYKTINWESIVLIAAMMPMSIAMENTGAAKLISDGLVNGLGQYGPLALLAGVYFATSLLTMFISNTATAVLVAPIALVAATSMEVSPVPFMFAVSVAASMCFASPFSTPPNALVMSPGRYTFMDYIRVGLPLQLIIAVVMILVLPLIFPFEI